MYGYCGCYKCNIVRQNLLEDKWIHLTSDPAPDGELPNDFFRDPVLKKDFGNKPEGCIWFSAGSWLYDPYHDGHDYEDNNDPHHNTSEHNVVVVKSPINILRITTFNELCSFHDKYSKHMCECIRQYKKYECINQKCITETHKIYHINWSKVKNDGYYGVAFTFKKILELRDYDFDCEKSKYLNWHNGFDVESLCIFDTKALNGLIKKEKYML